MKRKTLRLKTIEINEEMIVGKGQRTPKHISIRLIQEQNIFEIMANFGQGSNYGMTVYREIIEDQQEAERRFDERYASLSAERYRITYGSRRKQTALSFTD